MVAIFRRRRAVAQAALERWQTRLKNANDLYLKLYDEYFTFLQGQINWAENFKDETLKQFQTAVTDFSDFTVRLQAANQRLEAAQAEMKKNAFPRTSGFDRATDLLTEEPIVITGEELPLEMVQLFSSVVPKTTYTPEQLLAAMAELFDRTNQTLASILKAVKGVETDQQQTLPQLLEAVATLRSRLTQTALSFDPYEPRLDKIQVDVAAFAAIQDSDPLTAYAQSQTVISAAQSLRADLERASALQAELSVVSPALQQAIEHIHNTRNQVAVYKYPLAAGESQPPQAGMAKFALNEPTGNPDTVVADAERHQQTSLQLLLQGQLDDAEAEKNSALAAVQQAEQLVEAVPAAKTFIEQQVVRMRDRANQLEAAIGGGRAAIEQLQAEFLAKDFVGEPEKLKQAISTVENTPRLLQQLKQTYDQQHYLQGRRDLEALEAELQESHDSLSNIHACLEQLKQQRQQVREQVNNCRNFSLKLGEKIKAHDFTTAAATETSYRQAIVQLNQQHAKATQAVPTDWETAAAAANQLWNELTQIESAIDDQHQVYKQISEQIEALSAGLKKAQIALKHADVREASRQALQSVETILRRLQTQIAQPQSDWQSLSQSVENTRSLLADLHQQAEQDQQAAQSARKAIQRLDAKIRDSANQHAGASFLIRAREMQKKANIQLGNQDYETAERSARNSRKSLSDAIRRAERAAESRSRPNFGGPSGGGPNFGGPSGGGPNFGGPSGGGPSGGGPSGGGGYGGGGGGSGGGGY